MTQSIPTGQHESFNAMSLKKRSRWRHRWCYGLNMKYPIEFQVFDHWVSSWWCYSEKSWNHHGPMAMRTRNRKQITEWDVPWGTLASSASSLNILFHPLRCEQVFVTMDENPVTKVSIFSRLYPLNCEPKWTSHLKCLFWGICSEW